MFRTWIHGLAVAALVALTPVMAPAPAAAQGVEFSVQFGNGGYQRAYDRGYNPGYGHGYRRGHGQGYGYDYRPPGPRWRPPQHDWGFRPIPPFHGGAVTACRIRQVRDLEYDRYGRPYTVIRNVRVCR